MSAHHMLLFLAGCAIANWRSAAALYAYERRRKRASASFWALASPVGGSHGGVLVRKRSLASLAPQQQPHAPDRYAQRHDALPPALFRFLASTLRSARRGTSHRLT